MASSEIGDNASDRATNPAVPRDDATGAEPVEARQEEDRSTRRFTSSRIVGAADRERMLREARDVDFPTGLRGYDRAAVDRYVERVTRLITELEMSSSPEAAVRHALDEVSEETRDILQRAHQTADEITARSRSRADDRLEQAEHEAQEMLATAHQEAEDIRTAAQRDAQELGERTTGDVQTLRETAQRDAAELRESTVREIGERRESAAREAQQLRAGAQREADEVRGTARRDADQMLASAEARARELARSAEALWRERRRLLDDMRAVGEQLVTIGEVEGKRFPHPAEEPLLETGHPEDETPPTTDQPTAPSDVGTG
jgi:DivIVA domain-containing protein